MFRTLTRVIGPPNLIAMHSAELIGWLEAVWNAQQRQGTIGGPDNRSPLIGLPAAWGPHTGAGLPFYGLRLTVAPAANSRWSHLIYAYMIESTNLVQVARTILRECMHDERLGIPTESAQWWLRTTEDLFFRTPSPFQIASVRGDLRPEDGATRRNAYHRMFGMELPRTGNDVPTFTRASSVNAEFVSVFEEFLREVWVGIENSGNTSGTNPTDDAKIADLAERLHDMLMSRRQFGNLGREEFVAISAASWFHLAVESGFNWGPTLGASSPIVNFLRAEAASAEERLGKLGQRAGVPIHARSKSLFEIADFISDLLIEIERGIYNSNNVVNVPLLYTGGLPQSVEGRMRLIIRHWALLTGRDPKASKQVPMPPQVTPQSVRTNGASATGAPVGAGNR